MKLTHLLIQEMSMQRNDIISTISKASSFKHRLLRGDCGVFAIALATILGPEAKIVFFINWPEETITVDQLKDGEFDFYHVFIEYQGRYYDGSGEVTLREIMMDYSPGPGYGNFVTFVLDGDVVDAIRWNTNKTMDWRFYYEILRKPHASSINT